MGGNSGFPLAFGHLSAAADLRRAQEAAERAADLRRQAADAEALRYLAEMACPADVVDFGKRHDMPFFAEATWNNGFMAGWRAAQTRKADGTPDEERL